MNLNADKDKDVAQDKGQDKAEENNHCSEYRSLHALITYTQIMCSTAVCHWPKTEECVQVHGGAHV